MSSFDGPTVGVADRDLLRPLHDGVFVDIRGFSNRAFGRAEGRGGVDIVGARVDLEHRLSRSPTATELARDLSMDRDELVDMLVANDSRRPRGMGDAGCGHDAQSSAPAAVKLEQDDLGGVADRAQVDRLLGALPEAERVVLLLRIVKALKQTEIADRLGLEPRDVSRLLAHALAYMRDHLQ